MRKRNTTVKLLTCLISLTLAATLWYPSIGVKATTAPAGGNLADGLIAYWPFDGDATETANHLVTEQGGKALTYVDGVYGKAAEFNGKDTYLFVDDDSLNLGNSRNENNDKFTVSAWVNLGDSKNAYKYLVDKGENSGWDDNGCNWSNPYSIYIDGTQPEAALSNVFNDSDGGIETQGSSVTGGKYVQANEWFLLTITYDGSRVKIYHNGELLTQSNYKDGITFNEQPLYIGVSGHLDYYFKGLVDDLRIYDRTLPYNEVEQLYDNAAKDSMGVVNPAKGNVAYYPFDGDFADQSKYKNDAVKVAESGAMKFVAGMNGDAVTMSKGSYLCVPAADQLNLKDEFTITFWLKNGQQNGEVPVLYRQNPSYTDDNDNDWTYCLYINSWQNGTYTSVNMNTYRYSPSDWSMVTGVNLGTQLSFEDNKIKNTDWIHYSYTYKNGQMKCYINGKLKNKSDSADEFTIENASGDLLIGYDGDSFLTGTLDELKIFSNCLNADDILTEAKRVDSISLKDKDMVKSIEKGKSVTLESVILHDVDADKDIDIPINDKNINLVSSNKKIFTVSNNGTLTGVKAGKAKLTVFYGPHTAVYTVTVK